MRSARIDQVGLSSRDISYGLAPRLNAAGRMGSSLPALQLLMTRDPRRATQLAAQLERANIQRRGHVDKSQALALAELAEQPPGQACVFSASAAHPRGVVGLVASKLAEQTGLPAVVVALDDDVAHGSMRCAPPVNASDMLDACDDVLIRHGGHAAAGGFVCQAARLPELRARLCVLASGLLAGRDTRPALAVVAEANLPAEADEIWEWLPRLEPTGHGNEQPVFVTRDVMVQDAHSCGDGGQHLRLVLSGGGRVVGAMAFRVGERGRSLRGLLDIAYRLEDNVYRGERQRRLILLDWQGAGCELS
jgi:single-stranded-DNA-specific exonuclease